MQRKYRDLFDIPDEVSWLNCAQHSPALKSVYEAGLAGLEIKRHPWRIRSEHYQEMMRSLRQTFARLIGARWVDIALVPSVSYGITTAAKNLKLGPGKRVLVLAEQFPSNVYPWRMLAAREGGEVLTIQRPKEGGWTKAIEEALDERVAIVALPNLHWTDGSLIDLEALAPKIHDLGAALVLDLSQSLGIIPLDLEKLRPDYAVSVGYKWLLGPYRCSYFYVAPHRQAGQPLEDTWSGRKGSEDTSSITNYTDEYLPGALRFDVGERSDYIALPMAEAGLKQILDWGAPRIVEALKPLIGKIAEGAEGLGLKPTPVDERSPHIIGLAFPNAPARDLPRSLAEEGVYVSLRGNTLRVSPHLYNDERDVERFLNALDRLRQRGAA